MLGGGGQREGERGDGAARILGPRHLDALQNLSHTRVPVRVTMNLDQRLVACSPHIPGEAQGE